jgi:hypothetical protein
VLSAVFGVGQPVYAQVADGAMWCRVGQRDHRAQKENVIENSRWRAQYAGRIARQSALDGYGAVQAAVEPASHRRADYGLTHRRIEIYVPT